MEMELQMNHQCPASLITFLARVLRYANMLVFFLYGIYTIQFDCFKVFEKMHLKCASVHCCQYYELTPEDTFPVCWPNLSFRIYVMDIWCIKDVVRDIDRNKGSTFTSPCSKQYFVFMGILN